eukprot:6784251-Pyramimonas_sp.AAC.1
MHRIWAEGISQFGHNGYDRSRQSGNRQRQGGGNHLKDGPSFNVLSRYQVCSVLTCRFCGYYYLYCTLLVCSSALEETAIPCCRGRGGRGGKECTSVNLSSLGTGILEICTASQRVLKTRPRQTECCG